MAMRIIKNDEVTSSMIHKLRAELKADSKQVRRLLGITRVTDITKDLPIKYRDFNIWVLVEDDHITSYITFVFGTDNILSIKQLYVCHKFRRRGHASLLFLKLKELYPKIDCVINRGNSVMYQFAESVGLRREKPSETLTRLRGSGDDYQSNCFSNYLSSEKYIEQ